MTAEDMTAEDVGAVHMGIGAEYILPLRWTEDSALPDLADYLRRLTAWIPVTVVDGSGPGLFEHHRSLFPSSVRHIRPAPDAGSGAGNGKVTGVMTGVRASTAELLVIADDDVRYTRESLAAVVDQLRSADVVRPQNYFVPLPWHACWDTSRTLVNRAWSADFPGTLGVRREILLATDGYAPVLFENLEMIRTIKAAGGRERIVPDLFVARRPPRTEHFLKQRVRQAYDDFAQPWRLAAELALLPAMAAWAYAAARHRRRAAAACTGFFIFAALATGIAEAGRRRNNGVDVFPLRATLFAPLWALERALCIWASLGYRIAGGVPYAGVRLKLAAHPERELRRRHKERPPTQTQTPTRTRTRTNTNQEQP